MSRKAFARLAAGMALLLLAAAPTAAADGTTPIGTGLWPTTATGNLGSDNCGSLAPAQNGFCIDPGVGEPSTELGVNFSSSKAVSIVGVRIYRVDPTTVTGSLWAADGARLAGPTSFSPTATAGWQDASFTAPVAITPGQTYVASYFAPTPTYAVAHGFFKDRSYTVGPVTALKSLTYGGNGVFNNCFPSCFPTQTFEDSNYWVTPLWAYIHHCPEFTVGSADNTANLNTQLPARGTATNVPCLALTRIASRVQSVQHAVPKRSLAKAPRWGRSFSVRGERLWACQLQNRFVSRSSYVVRCNSGDARLWWSVVERHGG